MLIPSQKFNQFSKKKPTKKYSGKKHKKNSILTNEKKDLGES